MRARLGVTVANFALLVDVSSQSIYNWEHGRGKPQGKQLQSLASLRRVGRSAAKARLPFPKETPRARVEQLRRKTFDVLNFVNADRQDQCDPLSFTSNSSIDRHLARRLGYRS